jgi:hypothetical protein
MLSSEKKEIFMKKNKQKEMLIINPKTSYDLEDMVRILQEREASILVDMSKCKIKQNVLNTIIDYILSGTKSYMTINVKKVFPKVLVCYSKRQKI